MFICNINLTKNKFLKIGLYLLVAIMIIALMVLLRSCAQKSNMVYVTDSNNYEEMFEIPSANYTNVLKDCYENLDKYAGKKIKFSGFVHRLYDFSDTQFVLGREMITGPISNNQAEVVVVGFLCDYKEASSFKEDTWVEIEGTITKGYYHAEIPVVKVSNIKDIDIPQNPYVTPPAGGYVSLGTTFFDSKTSHWVIGDVLFWLKNEPLGTTFFDSKMSHWGRPFLAQKCVKKGRPQ